MLQQFHLVRDKSKNKKLKETRNIGFEDIEIAIKNSTILEILPHHNPKKYPHQIEIVFHKDGYPYVCAAEIQGKNLRLITIFPNRKLKHLLS